MNNFNHKFSVYLGSLFTIHNIIFTLQQWQQQFFLFLQNDFDLREHKGSYLKQQQHGNELQFPLKVIKYMPSVPY